MHRIEISVPARDLSPNKIALQNLRVADKIHHITLFCLAAEGWFSANPDKSYPELEHLLRSNSMNTYLIAVPFTPSEKFYLRSVNTDNRAIYECVYSCRPHPYALEELLTYSKSYEDNFIKLSNTGSMVTKNPPEISIGTRSIIDLVQVNKIVLELA
jgi:hypothetical protein